MDQSVQEIFDEIKRCRLRVLIHNYLVAHSLSSGLMDQDEIDSLLKRLDKMKILYPNIAHDVYAEEISDDWVRRKANQLLQISDIKQNAESFKIQPVVRANPKKSVSKKRTSGLF